MLNALSRELEPWRLFFPSALLLAPLNVLFWLAARQGLVPSSGISAATWHGREMLVGYGFAVIAGYLLPAMPITNALLLWLTWLAGRALWLAPQGLVPAWLDVIVGGAFPVVLAAFGIRRFAPVKRWRNLSFPLVIAVLGVAGVASYMVKPATSLPLLRDPTVLMVYVISLLIMIVGGRLVPAATIGVLRDTGREVRIAPRPLLELATVAGMLGLVALDGLGSPRGAGLLALAVAAILLAQISRWHSWLVLRDAEVWPLHVGYLWLAAGCALIGLERLELIQPPATGALHALAAGGIGSITLVMIIRVTHYRAGALRTPARWLHATQAAMAVAVTLRVAGGWALPAHDQLMLWLAAAAWAIAYAGTAAMLLPKVLHPGTGPAATEV